MRQAKARRDAKARTDFLTFLQSVWWKPWPLKVGRHTAEICSAIDAAIEGFLAGQSSAIDIEVPFRHGKSDLVSRALVPYFLGRTLRFHPDVILTGYGDSLVQNFSKDAKAIMASPEYRAVFPGVQVSRGSDAAQEWRVDGSTGLVTAAGLGGSLTGKGAHLLVVDDYCKNRAEARSETFRRAQWEAFGDAMTRRAPVSIALLCATSWHIDDVRQRLRKNEGREEAFPRFKRLSYPARNPDGSFLFPERFAPEWYAQQYAMLGQTWSAALLDCAPVIEGGNRFKIDRVQFHKLKDFPQGRYLRGWDLASTKKEREKDSPDFTVGTLGAVIQDQTGAPHFWVKDVVVGQWEAPERNRVILQTTQADGAGVSIYVEAFGAYKDAFVELKRLLQGRRNVNASRLSGDKGAKLADLEPIFEAGHVHLPEGAPWSQQWLQQFREFPSGSHDDCCDSAAICYHESLTPGSVLIQIP